MLIYFCLLGLIFLPTFKYGTIPSMMQKKPTKYFRYLVVCFSLVMGLRSLYVGSDIIQYEYRYRIYRELMINKGFQSEFGFSLLNAICNYLNIPFQLYLAIISFFLCVCVFSFYKKYSRNMALSAYLFMTIGLFTMYMSGLRQSLAISLCLIALMLLLDNRIILPVALILSASTLHNSAIIFFIIIPITKIRINKKTAYALVAVATLSIFYRSILVGIVSKYLPARYESMDLQSNYQMNVLLPIIAIAISIFCVFFSKTVDRGGRYDKSTSVFICMSCLNILFTILAFNNNQIGRIAYYFVNANMILIPNTIYQQNVSNKRIMVPIITTICLIYFLMSAIDGTLQIDNYQFFWEVR